MTNYDTLGQIIQKFNKQSDIGYKIDQQKILRLRDGIAHGRILSDAPDAINKLLKFSKPKNNDVEVEIAIELTDNWFKESIKFTYSVIKEVRNIYESL